MKIYLTGELYDEGYEGFDIKRAFTSEKQAIIDVCLHNDSMCDYELIAEIDVDEKQYDEDKYQLFSYWNVSYNPYKQYPILDITRVYGIIGYTQIPKEKKTIHTTAIHTIPKQIIFNFAVECESEEEAREIFHKKFKDAMDKFYAKNNVLKQNGKPKTWKIPKYN